MRRPSTACSTPPPIAGSPPQSDGHALRPAGRTRTPRRVRRPPHRPRRRRPAGHAGGGGRRQPRRADRTDRAGGDPPAPAAGPARAAAGTRRPGAAAGHRRAQRGEEVADRPRLLRHPHPAGDPAPPLRECRLVHGLHALPGRDRPGPARSPAQLPADGDRPDRPADRQRLAARRGHGSRRGHDNGKTGQQGQRQCVLRGRGAIADLSDSVAAIRAGGGVVAVASDLMALVLLKSPGEMGADIALGSAQRFGVPMGFGGPHAAFFATREAHVRAMPGRIIGVSRDARGKTALRMALQTREQHIRREKANSNICTSQVLLANMAGMYAVWHGPAGLRAIAARIHRLAAILAAGLRQAGAALAAEAFFDTVEARLGDKAEAIFRAAQDAGYNLRRVDAATLGISVDETTTREDVAALLGLFGAAADVEALDRTLPCAIPADLQRRSAILAHPVFNSHHTEHGMLRYLRRLQNRDLALDQAMIPLGSCTMKLNAAAEMMPVSWPEFAALHPFAPLDQARGYVELIAGLEAQLLAITGFDAICMQPNSGAQGEYAGLVAIRRYQAAQGQAQRTVCLIPRSAHGTNPATAQMCGLSVVVVNCDDSGNVAIDDLAAKAAQHAAALSCLMLTYPSTHGVFEESVKDICAIVHRHGGQVYMDGANLNAQVGLTRPADIGADVSHINLHKTFAIPHGGGGSGMGPIGLKAHLAPYMANHVLQPVAGPHAGQGAVAAAPWGSASILPISWMYITMMGAAGLKHASEVAILNANYVAARLREHYPVLYTGRLGRVAHECILDIRAIKAATGIAEIDIAKRLMDYGFHAPTVSFPVPGTLMVEPTESEDKGELDRFVAAMIAIREEIRRVENGEWSAAQSPLKYAPHTLADKTGEWTRPYSRALAAFPLPWVGDNKFWPAVNRIDDVHGDRHLFCACVPPEESSDG